MREPLPLQCIVSGGQTGVDRAALDVAIRLGISHGGWCPRGRRAEDGVLDGRYQLKEMASDWYADRSRQNVLDSDGTLILYQGRLEGGTLLTARFAQQSGKAILKVKLTQHTNIEECYAWLVENRIRVLNVAGPRASKSPEVYHLACDFLARLLEPLPA